MVCCHHTGWLPTRDIVVHENISCLLCKIVCVICVKNVISQMERGQLIKTLLVFETHFIFSLLHH